VTAPASSHRQQELEEEVARLRARLAELEAELADRTARANAAVAAAQERAYWLDRWQVDLNALMRRRGAAELRAVLRAVRTVRRLFVLARRRLRG
jgi:chromosome segregation ATPase